MTELVHDVDRITTDLLEALDSGEILGLRWPCFVPATHADEIGSRLIHHSSLSSYRNTPELMRVGQSHFETHDPDGTPNQKALSDYLDKAETLMAEIRICCAPYESPMERLWRQLDADVGLEFATIGGRAMFAGIVRVFPPESELLPHDDRFSRDAPYLPIAHEIEAQFAANIYLHVPPQGGEIQLWGKRFTDDELTALRADSTYGACRDKIPPPVVEIRPDPGDLVVIDATRLHGVRKAHSGTRVGMSCFLGYRRNASIVCWS